MYKNEHIFEFYLKNNNKKDKKEKEELSEASKKVLSCILALYYDSEYTENFDLAKVIKMIMLKDTRYNMLSTKEEIDSLLEELSKNVILESQIANNCINIEQTMSKEDKDSIIKDLYNKYLTLAYTPRLSHLVNLEQNYLFDGHENVLEHIYGTLLLALGIQSEYNYFLDYERLFSTLLLHETDEIVFGDDLCDLDTQRKELTEKSRKAISEVLKKLRKEKEYVKQVIDYKKRSDITMEYASLINRLEYILQTKMYEIRGMYNQEGVFEKAYEQDKLSYQTIPCLRGILEKAKKL